MVPIAMTGGSTGSAEVAVDTVYATFNRTSGAARYVEPGVEVCMLPEIGDYIQAAPCGLSRVGADRHGRCGAGARGLALDPGGHATHNEVGLARKRLQWT